MLWLNRPVVNGVCLGRGTAGCEFKSPHWQLFFMGLDFIGLKDWIIYINIHWKQLRLMLWTLEIQDRINPTSVKLCTISTYLQHKCKGQCIYHRWRYFSLSRSRELRNWSVSSNNSGQVYMVQGNHHLISVLWVNMVRWSWRTPKLCAGRKHKGFWSH